MHEYMHTYIHADIQVFFIIFFLMRTFFFCLNGFLLQQLVLSVLVCRELHNCIMGGAKTLFLLSYFYTIINLILIFFPVFLSLYYITRGCIVLAVIFYLYLVWSFVWCFIASLFWCPAILSIVINIILNTSNTTRSHHYLLFQLP